MTNHYKTTIEGRSVDYPPGHQIDWHAHKMHQFVHALSGVMQVEVNEAVWVIPPGRGLWIPGRVPHTIHCVGQIALRTVYLDGPDVLWPDEVGIVETSPLMREVILRLCEPAQGGEISQFLAEILVHELRAAPARRYSVPASRDERIKQIYECLRARPDDTTGLAEWSDRLHLSARSLIRLIKNETGMSFREYRRQIRIMMSIAILADGKAVTVAAFDCGFESVSAFIQAFRQVTGVTPGKFLQGGAG